MTDPRDTPTIRGSNTLSLGPGFATLAREIATRLRRNAAEASSSGSGANALRLLVDEAEGLARRFEAWPSDPPSANERLELVNRLSRLKKAVR